MSTPNPTHIIPDNVIVLTKRAAFESVAGTGIYHSEDFREGVSLALDALAEVLTDAGYSIVPAPMADTLTKIARLHGLGYGFPTINGVRVKGAKARLYCVHCEVDYPCQTMALFPKDIIPAADGENP